MENNKRAIMHDVSNGDCKFYAAATLPAGVKDASTLLYNATIGLFPDIDGSSLNIMVHGNIITSCAVKTKNGIVVNIKPLISCICEDIERCPNGNIIYRNLCIVRFGCIDNLDKYGYAVPNNNKGFIYFTSIEDAYKFIDENC